MPLPSFSSGRHPGVGHDWTLEQLTLAVEVAEIGTFEVVPFGGPCDFSPQARRIFGVAPEDAMDRAAFYASLHPEDRERVRARVMEAYDPAGSGTYRIEYRILWPDGTIRWIDARGQVFFAEAEAGQERQPLRLIGTVLDITERVRGQEALRAALETKDALLHEVNHRVKNSLQLISSLLTLQIARLAPELRPPLVEVQARVDVVARMHQRLYQDADHAAVDLAGFLRELCTDTITAVTAPGRVRLDFPAQPDGAPVPMPVEIAVPLALIANELVTNALKYAFRDGATGVVRVMLSRRPGEVVLLVEDDGIGLPAGFRPEAGQGVGMRVLTALAKQIRAKVLLTQGSTGAGTAFHLMIPCED
jgi:PAS domain S-box-containing protein